MKKSVIILLALFTFTLSLCAQSIKIALFNSREINSLTVYITQGKYVLKKQNEILGEYRRGSIFHISRFGNSLELRDKRNFIGNFQELELACISDNGILKIRPVNPVISEREYDDNLLVRVHNNKIQLINKLDLEKYIAAVIEAEGGNRAEPEFYKAQAVLIRTFTIKNLYKHAEEGFDLCDEVHCQAYKKRCSQHEAILTATRETAGKVLIDDEGVLIMSPFHSNCGGQTSSSGMVWQKDLPYLKSVRDPFCSSGKHFTWSTTIPKSEWLHFIAEYTGNTIDYSRHDFSFMIRQRTKFVAIHGIDLNLRTVREYFGLKSAYFGITDKGNTMVFDGKGYGHGVGMCQEGAMEMARVGYSWIDIIRFYFQDAIIADYREMELHRFKPNGAVGY